MDNEDLAFLHNVKDLGLRGSLQNIDIITPNITYNCHFIGPKLLECVCICWTYPPSKILMRVGSLAGCLTETSFSTCSSFERSHDTTPFIFLPKLLTSTGISSGFNYSDKRRKRNSRLLPFHTSCVCVSLYFQPCMHSHFNIFLRMFVC